MTPMPSPGGIRASPAELQPAQPERGNRMRSLVLPESVQVLSVSVKAKLCGWACINVCIHSKSIHCMYKFSFFMSRQLMSPGHNLCAWQEMVLVSQEIFCISSHCVFRKKF